MDPLALKNLDITISDVFTALKKNNENTGGSYIEKGRNTFYIRAEGLIESIRDIENIVIKNLDNSPVYIHDIAKVRLGSATRFGAMTKNGKGEAVGGITLMLKGANSSEVIQEVKDRVEEVQKSLPEGVRIDPYLDRAELVGRTINTVTENLVIGGLIVIFILVLLLGHLRSGLIVASVIPLSLLFAFIMMRIFGVSANLMSLGAIDFGIVIDGAVIIVENIVYRIYSKFNGKVLNQKELDREVGNAASGIYKSAAFGVIIILIVFIPIMTLTGIEGKMFKPMAQTFSFAILGAFLLSLTYVPMMAALTLNKKIKHKRNLSDKIIDFLKATYNPVLNLALRFKYLILGITLVVFGMTLWAFTNMGGEFLPDLEEGDLAMQMTIPPGSSLSQSIESSTKAEKILLENFPEVKSVISKIGTAEVPTDPMAIEDADIMIILKEKKVWTSAETREELVDKMKEELTAIPEASFEFTQPIQLRFNELMTGVKTDIAVKIYGENLDELFARANEAANMISGMEGAADIKVEQITGLPQYVIKYDRAKIARYGINISDLNDLVRTSFAGKSAGVIFEGERRFELVVRLDSAYRNNIIPENLFIRTIKGNQVPLSEVAEIEFRTGPAQISRDDTKRRVTIGINVRNRDVESLVEEINAKLSSDLKLKPGYYVTYGGAFENLENARKRLSLSVPLALIMILVLLFFTFNSVKYALLIFSAVPLSAVGGVIALLIRGMPFSISAGVGFIALFGIAVLNGIVLISYYNEIRKNNDSSIREIVVSGANSRLRPVMMTAITDVLGFLPMAVSVSAGAEVQRPLATVVIGGIITSTLLTMIILPILYLIFNNPPKLGKTTKIISSFLIIMILFVPFNLASQDVNDNILINESWIIENAIINNPEYQNAELKVEKARAALTANIDIPATEFSYQRGQINSAIDDRYISVNQSLGSILKNIRSYKVQQTKLAGYEMEKLLVERSIINQSLKAYNNWLYNLQILSNQQTKVDLFSQYVTIAEKKYQLGDINLMEKNLLESEYFLMEQELISISSETEVAENELKQILFISDTIARPDKLLYREVIDQPVDSLRKDLTDMVDVYHELINTIGEQQVKLERSAFFPEISGGYFNQKIDGIKGFEGWQVGLSFPILAFRESSAARQAKIQNEIRRNEMRMEKLNFRNDMESKLIKFNNLGKNLEFYNDKMIGKFEVMRDNIRLQYEQGNISYIEFVQNMKVAFNIFDEYSLIIKEFNDVTIDLKYMIPELTHP